MEIKLKYTGEVIKVNSEHFDEEGKFIGFLAGDPAAPGGEVFYPKEDVAEAPDWDAYRREAAKAAMLKMLMCDFNTDAFPDPQEICGMAVLYADELIEKLQGK
jgi:hypothetical protein